METAFREIKKQSGYGFWYEKDVLKGVAKVSVSVKDGSLKQVLDLCFKDRPLSYKLVEKTVVVRRLEKSGENGAGDVSRQKNGMVRGRVADEVGKPVVGATVKLLGTASVVLSDEHGNFSIAVGDGNAVLQVSYMGFIPFEKEVKAGSFITVVLKEELSTLDNVNINAGYYTVKDKERTGSISRVSAALIEKQVISNPLQALQGRVAGLVVTQNTGVPGGSFSVQIRGRSSLNVQVTNDPLYVVDGVIYPSVKMSTNTSNVITAGGANPLAMVNPDEIESIEVLKDADATAIYGSRGANGVILITTKKGKGGALRVGASLNHGYAQVGHKVELLGTADYLMMRREAFKNDGLSPTALDYDVNGTWDQQKYTDWQQVLIGNNATITDANLNISGGNGVSSYRIGGSYQGEGTVFPGSFGLDWGGVHASLNLGSLENRLKATFTVNYSHAKGRLLTADLTNFISLAPNYPDLHDGAGKLNWTYKGTPMTLNPMAFLLNTITSKTDNLIGNIALSYRVLDNLSLKASLGYTTMNREELTKRPLEALSPATSPTSVNRQGYFGNNLNSSWIAEPQVNYRASLGHGRLETLVGLSFQGNQSSFQNILASGFNSDELLGNIGNAATLTKNENTNSSYLYTAVFSRINYNLLDKYILNLTGRRDGSSRFGPGRQFANFGAVGAAWVFSGEGFMQRAFPALSLGKIRGSFGITGNDQIPDYGYLQLWTNNGVGTYQGFSTLTINRLSNADYGWETTRKMELALQLGFLKDRFNIEMAYYRNRSSDQLLLNPTPPSVGSTGILVNLPATVQNQGWEIEGSARLIDRGELEWSASFNLTIPKNTLIAYPGLSSSANRITYVVGKPLSIRQVYNTNVDPQSGNYAFEDRDASVTQNEGDRYLTSFIGQRFYGGLQNSIRYKRLTLDFLLSFVSQTGNNYMSGIPYGPGYFTASATTNQPTAVLDRWQAAGDISNVKKFSTTISGYINYLNARGDGGLSITDASYLKLRSVSLSYQLPNDWLERLRISDARLSLQGQNVFTLTRYIGLDPESQSVTNLPPLRAITIGLKLNF
ncbi:SusC/RagA family TonB-linked outer membrane protein [Pedobacter frigiditerrae]|nr:SusC/RagA family TonB-linked outer membrane protein [Pedobacter frigiditerrae]